MKKFISLALAAVVALSANAKRVETAQFSSVKVNVPVHLVVVKGRTFSVDVISRDAQLATAVKWSVKDGILRLSAQDIESLEKSGRPVSVIVTAPVDVEYKVGSDMKGTPIKHRRHRR
ncbi:MAG: hypothetical protein KBT29_06990 [Prevotellaceae bacterium]|nr:hypothetical protein [Candidatus Minthosoma caballi]